MAGELDLIPSDYRHRVWLRRWSARVVVSTAIAAAGILVAAALSWHLTNRLGHELAALEARRTLNAQQQAELQSLQVRRDALQRQLSTLSGLQSSVEPQELFSLIDQTLGFRPLWFRRWEFRRAGVLVSEDRPELVSTGYFIVVPATDRSNGNDDWTVENHMLIAGQAVDHSALSGFVTELLHRPTVADARVQKTSLVQSAARELVDFELTVVLKSTVSQ